MSAKWSIFKTGAICLVCFFCSMAVVAQNDSEYEERIEQYQKDWSKLIPRYTKVQYAGSMGLFSLGTGWVYGKNNQWETDLMFGYIPKYSTEHGKLCITLKENFTPWDLIIGQKGFSFQPLSCGIYVNSVIDDDFWVSEPGKYPNAYYTFSTKIRFNFFVGQRIAFKIPKAKRDWAKSLALFYEISSNELYIVSAANNHYLKPSNYLHLSLGIKIQWF